METENTITSERPLDLIIERRELEGERLLAMELITSPESFEADLSAAFGQIGEELVMAGVAFAGPCVCAHSRRRGLHGQMRVVAGIPFLGEVEPGPETKIVELPRCHALVGTLHGSYERLPEAWVEMNAALVGGERPRPRSMPFDRFLLSMTNAVSPDELITELVIPLA
jgi:effector-binding domain-containing protein